MITNNFTDFVINDIISDITENSFKLIGCITCIKLNVEDCSNYTEGIMTIRHSIPGGILFDDRINHRYAIVNDFEDTDKFYRVVRIKNELQ